MAKGTAGSLVVSLGLDAAEYTRGLTRAEYQAYQFGEKIGKAIRGGAEIAAASIATLATSSVAAFAAFDTLIKKAGDFQDLAEKTGASAEGLASFSVAAGTAGTTVDAIAQASIKLTKNLTGVDDESKAAGAAITALGLNLKDFKALAPEDQISEISKSLAGFQDGAGKTAVATALLGKSGAELLPFLKALEEQGGRQVILTAEQIRQADEYADRQAKTRAELQIYAQALATQALPALTDFTGAITDAIKEMTGIGDGATKLAGNKGIQTFADDAAILLANVIDIAKKAATTFQFLGESIGVTAAIIAAASRGSAEGAKSAFSFDPSGALDAARQQINGISALITDAREQGKKYTAESESMADRVAKRIGDRNKNAALAAQETRGFTPKGNQLQFGGAEKKAGGGKDDPTNKELDNALKALEKGIAQEKEILASRNKMLDLYNGENLISTQDYYAGRRVAIEDAVSKEAALYDKQIATLQAYQATAAKATDRETAQGKINDLVEKKAKLYRDAGEAALEMGFKERKAADDLAKQINAVNADVLELTGNLSAASKIRLDAQYDDLTKRLTANGDAPGLTQLNRLKDLKTAQADVGQQNEELARITANLKLEEDRVAISRLIGADTELTSLKKIGDARTSAIAQMESYVQAQEAIANASGNPKLVQGAQQARIELEKLRAVADPLGDKITSVFQDSFGSAFADFITGTKTASEAFQAFGRSVINQLANIAAQEAATALFGKKSAGGSGAGLFGTLLGAGSMALGDFTGTSIGGTYGSSTQAGLDALIGSLDGKASGGPVSAGGMYQVNEQGPELLDVNGKSLLMMGSQSGRVTANKDIGGGGMSTTVVNQTTGRVDNVVEQRISANERILILQEAEKRIFGQLADANSRGSKTMSRNFKLQRSRA